jgi:hypothetical protein
VQECGWSQGKFCKSIGSYVENVTKNFLLNNSISSQPALDVLCGY